MCSRKVRYWEEIYVFINVSWTLYIFLIEVSRKIGKCARSETDDFSVNFCHVLSLFYLWERIHDPVSVTWIAFNGKLMSFRIKIFKKQFVCLLFSVGSFMTLVENMIAGILFDKYNLRFILISRITFAKMSANFIQFLLSSSATREFYFKICVTIYSR